MLFLGLSFWAKRRISLIPMRSFTTFRMTCRINTVIQRFQAGHFLTKKEFIHLIKMLISLIISSSYEIFQAWSYSFVDRLVICLTCFFRRRIFSKIFEIKMNLASLSRKCFKWWTSSIITQRNCHNICMPKYLSVWEVILGAGKII